MAEGAKSAEWAQSFIAICKWMRPAVSAGILGLRSQ
jgi:hypothetical protein